MTDETFSHWHRIIRTADTPYLQRLTEGFERCWRQNAEIGDAANADANHSLLEYCQEQMELRRDSYTGEIDS